MKATLIGPLFAAALLFAVGCGTSEYEKRLEAHIEQMKKGSAFDAMQPAVTLAVAEDSVQVRMLPGMERLGEADGNRASPPGYDMKGRAATYEGFVTDSEDGKIAYYCYLGGEKLNPQMAEHFEYYIKSKFEKSFPNADPQWQEVNATTATGAAVEWKKIRVDAKQDYYYVDSDGAGRFEPLDGFFEMWVRKEAGVLLKMAWRVPDSIVPNVEIDKWAPRVAGSMRIGGEAAAAPAGGADDP